MRHAFSWQRVLPFVLGGLVGVPLGAIMLTMVDPSTFRFGIGCLLIVFSLYNLLRPEVGPFKSHPALDTGIGVVNGAVGGLTGLGGVVITVWCQMRDWPKDVQRTVFQPVILATMTMSAISFAVTGAYTVPTVKLFFIGLPALLIGLWLGLKLYGKLDDAMFSRVILLLLLVSGLTLVIPLSIFK